jgi:hypothetical protein
MRKAPALALVAGLLGAALWWIAGSGGPAPLPRFEAPPAPTHVGTPEPPPAPPPPEKTGQDPPRVPTRLPEPAAVEPPPRADLRTLEVALRDAQWVPVVGHPLTLRDQGGQLVGTIAHTDLGGRAWFRDLPPKLLELFSMEGQCRRRGSALATADLGAGDARLEIELAPASDLVVQVRLHERPHLPGDATLTTDGCFLDEISRRPEVGELRGRVRPSRTRAPLTVWLTSSGYPRATAETRRPDPSGPLVATIDLDAGGVLSARVIPPRDLVFKLAVERFDEPARRFVPRTVPIKEPTPDGRVTARVPYNGRYRFVDTLSGVAAEPAEVPDKDAPPRERVLDLSAVDWVTGLVHVPEGERPETAWVALQPSDAYQQSLEGGERRVPVAADGTFRTRAGSFPLTLVARHASLAPAVYGGTATVLVPPATVELWLDPGSTASFRLAPGAAKPKRLRVLHLREEPERAVLSSHEPEVRDGVARWGGFAPGRATLWIDASSAAPLVLRDVQLRPGANDLGELAFPGGSRIRVRLRVQPGLSAPRMEVLVIARDGPSYSRKAGSRGETELTVAGLGAGRFRVRGYRMPDPALVLEQDVTLDGVNEAVIDVDLR